MGMMLVVFLVSCRLTISNVKTASSSKRLSLAADFQLCRELDVSCNKLEALPPEISNCQRLRKLKGNGNYMKTIPEGLGDCCLLEVG